MGMYKLLYFAAFYLLLMVPEDANAQKRWDGEAGNGDWNDEKNWYPDGLPDSSTNVILDNSIVLSSYTVKISSDTSSVKLYSLTIQASPNVSITLEIPKTNKATPAMSIFANKLSIIIGKGGILINKSTAVAGNTLLMNGKIRIENGGKYSHQTVRGNAYIITKLESILGTEKGMVEFDVPGNATYPISLSGRQYGSIWLNSSNKERRTYTGTGINDLMIKGDLIINDSVNFNSSLTGNIYLSGNLSNKGTAFIKPSTADSVKRELVFIGDSAEFYSSGSLLLGEFFNGIRLKKGTLELKSSIQVDRSTCTFTVDPYTRLMMDTFFVYGTGQFKTDSNAVLGIASPDGISMIPSNGNIRTIQKNISPKTSFIFYGSHEQVTGSAFPSLISSLYINKNNGSLRLSLPLAVNDSLLLSKGILRTSATESLNLRGIAYSKTINQYGWTCGNDSSFIVGPLSITNKIPDIFFPVGNEGVFAPMNIKFRNTTNRTTEVEYITAQKPNSIDLQPPLRSLDKKGYWNLRIDDQAETVIDKAIVELGISSQQTNALFNPPSIAMAETVASLWTITENCSYDPVNTIVSGTIPLKDLVLSTGSTQEEILALKRIDLTYIKDDRAVLLTWTISGDINFKDMYIEKSIDGVIYHRIHEHTDFEYRFNQYQKKTILNPNRASYFRIVCRDETDTKIISNIICVKNEKGNDLLFPNPADYEMKIRVTDNAEKRIPAIQVIDMTGRIIHVVATKNGNMLSINTSGLPRGSYRLIIHLGTVKKIYRFMRN